jgi:hypothetical protein
MVCLLFLWFLTGRGFVAGLATIITDDNNKEFIYCYLSIGTPKSNFAVLHPKD